MYNLLNTELTIPASYDFVGPADSQEIYLLLHGYSQNQEIMHENCQKFLPEEAQIISLNGPFLMPQRNKKEELVLVFSWYFYDAEKDFFFVPISTAAQYVNQVLEQLNPKNKPVTLIGFSQGGYVVPFVQHKNIKQGIQIHSRCRSEDLNGKEIAFPIYAFHGEKDEMVDPIRSQLCFEKLQDQGLKGEFKTLPNTGHDFSDELILELSNFLNK